MGDALDPLFQWGPAIIAFVGVVTAGLIGVRGASKTAREERTNPAYAELLKSDESKTARLDKLELLVDTLRKERRDLEDKLDAQDDRLNTLSRDLDVERHERQKLQERVDWFKVTVGDAEDYIRRSWENLRRDYPHAWDVFVPVPSFMTDPGFPAIPRAEPIPSPPDDGQPGNIDRPDTTGGTP